MFHWLDSQETACRGSRCDTTLEPDRERVMFEHNAASHLRSPVLTMSSSTEESEEV
jgi:hypothetical protein